VVVETCERPSSFRSLGGSDGGGMDVYGGGRESEVHCGLGVDGGE
jgi:hypothetical protein